MCAHVFSVSCWRRCLILLCSTLRAPVASAWLPSPCNRSQTGGPSTSPPQTACAASTVHTRTPLQACTLPGFSFLNLNFAECYFPLPLACRGRCFDCVTCPQARHTRPSPGGSGSIYISLRHAGRFVSCETQAASPFWRIRYRSANWTTIGSLPWLVRPHLASGIAPALAELTYVELHLAVVEV